ncbi:MAG: hypothetical protein JSV88_25980 [Candidatus Aminicenantes bacterium]|nr:MAG: hypothetical protein JSV88_25980 [Candidatus Aminicenantes bacterium]
MNGGGPPYKPHENQKPGDQQRPGDKGSELPGQGPSGPGNLRRNNLERSALQKGRKISADKPGTGSSKIDNAAKHRKELEHQTSQDYLDQATGPPKTDNLDKIIKASPIKIPKMEPPKHLPDKGIQDKELPKKDVKDLKPGEGLDGRHNWQFPPEVVRRGDKVLPPEEVAERKKIFQAKNTLGCKYGDRTAAPGEWDRFDRELSTREREMFKDPNIEIVITGFAYNKELSEKRAQDAKREIQQRYGVDSSRIKLEAVGEELTGRVREDKADDHRDRVVMIDFVPAEKDYKKEDGGPQKKLHKVSDLPDDFKDKFNLQEGRHPRFEAFIKEGKLFLPNADEGALRWININDVPQGYSKLNNYNIIRKGNEIDAGHRYLEKPQAIENEWRRRKEKGIYDTSSNPVKMDQRELQRHVKNNKMLNQWMESYLRQGNSPKEARQKTEERSLYILKQTIAPLVGTSI